MSETAWYVQTTATLYGCNYNDIITLCRRDAQHVRKRDNGVHGRGTVSMCTGETKRTAVPEPGTSEIFGNGTAGDSVWRDSE